MAEPDSNLPQDPSPHDGWEMVCDGILRTEFGRRPSRAVSDAIMQLTAEEALQRKTAPRATTMTLRERIQYWRRMLLSGPELAFGAALFFLVGLVALLWSSGLIHVTPAPPTGSVCVLSDAAGMRWASGSAHPKIGDKLSAGTLRLAAGVAELTFASSAKVAVEGPAEIKLTGVNSMELAAGKIATIVPRRARGFAVKTPTATVVDLGTRFGAMVDSAHASEVDVFQGHVELTATATADNPEGQWQLTQGMAMIADSHGTVAASALPEAAFPQPGQNVLARPQNCGFDVSARAAVGGIPVDFGYWSGPAYSLTGPGLGIQPYEGAGMLQFHNNTAEPAGDSEVWQLVDMHPFNKLVAGGMVEAKLSAEFNRIPGDARAGDKFGLTLAAFHGVPGDAKLLWTQRGTAAIALADKELATDNDPATWEKIEVSAKLPAETDFVIVEIRAVAPKENTGGTPLFPGHFADRVDLRLITPLQASSIATSR